MNFILAHITGIICTVIPLSIISHIIEIKRNDMQNKKSVAMPPIFYLFIYGCSAVLTKRI